MQKMLASVEACAAPSVMLPAGEPVSVMVRAPLPPGPNAPPVFSTQSGYSAGQSVAWVAGVQAIGDAGRGVGQPGVTWSPAKQPLPIGPVAPSRQNPQKTLFCVLTVLLTAVLIDVPVVRSKAIGSEPMLLTAGGG